MNAPAQPMINEHAPPDAMTCAEAALITPDGRYLVIRGRLWRRSNPDLAPTTKDELVAALMDARRSLRGDGSDAQRCAARHAVDEAKRALGERGPVWWTDGAPDFNRKLVQNTPYAAWFAEVARCGRRREGP